MYLFQRVLLLYRYRLSLVFVSSISMKIFLIDMFFTYLNCYLFSYNNTAVSDTCQNTHTHFFLSTWDCWITACRDTPLACNWSCFFRKAPVLSHSGSALNWTLWILCSYNHRCVFANSEFACVVASKSELGYPGHVS